MKNFLCTAAAAVLLISSPAWAQGAKEEQHLDRAGLAYPALLHVDETAVDLRELAEALRLIGEGSDPIAVRFTMNSAAPERIETLERAPDFDSFLEGRPENYCPSGCRLVSHLGVSACSQQRSQADAQLDGAHAGRADATRQVQAAEGSTTFISPGSL